MLWQHFLSLERSKNELPSAFITTFEENDLKNRVTTINNISLIAT